MATPSEQTPSGPYAQGWQNASRLTMPRGVNEPEQLTCPQCQNALTQRDTVVDCHETEYTASGRTLLQCRQCQRWYYVVWHCMYIAGTFYE